MKVLIHLIVAGLWLTRVEATTPAGEQEARYAIEPQFRLLRFGEIMPAGWIQEQMVRDLTSGFAGHMPEIAPKTCGSQIFEANRNQPDRLQNAGGGSWGGAEGMWWNGETEGNWRSGNTMMAILSGLTDQRTRAEMRVADLLKYQDADGYMGIYAPPLRWASGDRDNGELWTQTCLLRGLIAYYEATGEAKVLSAVERAAQLTMSHYAPGRNDPFGTETMNHNLMFVDVMERLYDLTGNPAYRDFGLYLYRDFSKDTKTDVSLGVLIAANHPFEGHGATTYEGLRVPIWAAYVSGDPTLLTAAEEALAKAWPHVSPTGGPVSDEMIANVPTNPDTGGYEGCGQKEWMTTLLSAAQKTGRAMLAEQAETTFYNSVQGSRLADGTGVDYVTTDNIFKIDGAIMNRCVFSPAHEDVANCCAPNFTQIGAIFVRNMWMRSLHGLALVLPGPCTVRTIVHGVPVQVEEQTQYPFSELIDLRVTTDVAVEFSFQLRVPSWATEATVTCPGADIHRMGDWVLVEKKWESGDRVVMSFGAAARLVPANNGEFYIRRGPLFYAVGIPAVKKPVKDYPLPGFHDYLVFPAAWGQARFAVDGSFTGASIRDGSLVPAPDGDPRFPWDHPPVHLEVSLLNLDTMKRETVGLVPMGASEAILRRMTFPPAPN